MKTYRHFLLSVVLVFLFYPVFGWKALIILIGGVLIDIDHYFWYCFKHKNFNIFHTYKFYITKIKEKREHENKGILLIFHTVEFLVPVIILSFFSQYVMIFSIGLLAHYLLDFLYLYFVLKQVIANHSIINWVIKNKN